MLFHFCYFGLLIHVRQWLGVLAFPAFRRAPPILILPGSSAYLSLVTYHIASPQECLLILVTIAPLILYLPSGSRQLVESAGGRL